MATWKLCKSWEAGRQRTDWLTPECHWVQRPLLAWAELNARSAARHLPCSVVFSSLRILLILSFKGAEQDFMMFKRCKGAVKALCTACQITLLMASLSGCLVSTGEKKGQVGGANYSLPCHSKITHSSLYLLPLLSFLLSSASQVHPACIQMVVMTW